MTHVTFQPSALSHPPHALHNGKKGKGGNKGKSKPAPRNRGSEGSGSMDIRSSALVRLEDPANRPPDFKPLTGIAADTAARLGLNIPIDPSYQIGSATAERGAARAQPWHERQTPQFSWRSARRKHAP